MRSSRRRCSIGSRTARPPSRRRGRASACAVAARLKVLRTSPRAACAPCGRSSGGVQPGVDQFQTGGWITFRAAEAP
jgi:hypothetical protein